VNSAIVLLNPKTPFNVGGVIRAASIFGASQVWWTGDRVSDGRYTPGAPNISGKKWRLPREERMKAYDIEWGHDEFAVEHLIAKKFTPVCVEVDPTAELLPYFEHPDNAVYIFGPEDSGIGKGIRRLCHRFVTIPSKSCLNLAAATNVVLYDRFVKQMTELDQLTTDLAEEIA